MNISMRNWPVGRWLFIVGLVGACVPVEPEQFGPLPPPTPEISAEIGPQSTELQPVKVGLILPLSGPSAGLGVDFLRAAKLALEDISGSPLSLSVRDSAGTAEGAVLAANSLFDPAIEVIVGPIFGDGLQAIAPIMRERGIPVIGFSTKREPLGNGVFSLGYRPEDEVESILSFVERRGLSRLLLLAPDNDYGQAVGESFTQFISARPYLEAVGVQFYDQTPQDIRRVANELAEVVANLPGSTARQGRSVFADDPLGLPPIARLTPPDVALDEFIDAILIADNGAGAAILVRQLVRSGSLSAETQLLGLRPWQFADEMMRDRAFLGAWYPASSRDGLDRFENRFVRQFEAKPHPLAILAYDAIRLVNQVFGESDGGDTLLTVPSGYEGHADIFRLRSDGRAQRVFAIEQATPLDPLRIQGRPERFDSSISN